MAVAAVPTSTAATTTACLSPQLPLISLRETVAKINMPAVLQPTITPQIPFSTAVSNEPMYNLTISNGEIIHSSTTNAVPKITVPSVAALAVSRDFKNDPVTTTSPKPIIVTVAGMPGMTAGKHLTTVTNVLTAPLLSAPVQMVAQHFTTDKIPSSSIVTLPTLSRVGNNITSPVLTMKPRQAQHITPLLPGSIITSKGQIVIASANNPLTIGSSAASVMTTMSLNNSIVTVTPVIMTSTAPLVTLSGTSMALNPVSQAQVLSNLITTNVKPCLTTNKAIVPATYLKPLSIGPSPATFPVQQATITPAITLTAAPPQPNISPVATPPTCAPSLPKDAEMEPKSDPKTSADFDPIQAMDWKDGVGTLPGSDMKFRLTEFGTLELVCHDDLFAKKKDEGTTTITDDTSSESRQKPTKNKEMYKDEGSLEKISQNGTKSPQEDVCRCENCNCFGLKNDFCKSGRFCSQNCVSAFANKRNAWLKRGATKEKIKRKKLKIDEADEKTTENKKESKPEVKSDPKSEIQPDSKSSEPSSHDAEATNKITKTSPPTPAKNTNSSGKDMYETKKKFSWEEYLKLGGTVAAPVKLFKENQTFPSNENGFCKDMKLEGVDPKHPSLFCVLSVMETRGYRVRLHFDGYSECYDFWVNADSQDIFPVGWCEKTGHQLQPPKGFDIQEFNWSNYLKMSKAEAAPKSLFTWKSQPPNPHFRRGMKLEAVDKKNSSLVCVATVTDVMDNRFLIHFDGWEDVYDYWADATSPHLHPVHWCKENGVVLTPPKDTKENVTFSWSKYLSDTRSSIVPNRAFKPIPPNEFKVGMKIEAVDRRNPILIRVATIVDKTEHTLLLHFDGWSSVYDYWVEDTSPDIHPIHWCSKTGHPLEPPIVIVPGQTGPCPTIGCLGQGHIKGPKYTSHHSAFGCPYSQLNLNKMDTIGQDRVIIPKESLSDCSKKLSENGGAIDGLRRCPTPGCNGVGHVKGKYSVHHRVSGCPLAEKNAQKNNQQQNTPVPSPSSSSTPPPNRAASPSSVNSSDVKSLDSVKTRNGVGRGKQKLKVGTGLRGRPPKHITAMRLEALKKAREESEKKSGLEEKVHHSVFNPLYSKVPKELPMSFEHNTQLIPGLSSIKGTAVRQWSYNQVAKFVSSLKGCADMGKIFREELVDGEALLELNQSDLVDTMHLKVGPAVKIFSSIVAFRESEKYEQPL